MMTSRYEAILLGNRSRRHNSVHASSTFRAAVHAALARDEDGGFDSAWSPQFRGKTFKCRLVWGDICPWIRKRIWCIKRGGRIKR
jgi:hypothetical protein